MSASTATASAGAGLVFDLGRRRGERQLAGPVLDLATAASTGQLADRWSGVLARLGALAGTARRVAADAVELIEGDREERAAVTHT